MPCMRPPCRRGPRADLAGADGAAFTGAGFVSAFGAAGMRATRHAPPRAGRTTRSVIAGLLLQRLGGRGILLDQCGVLLGHFVHLDQRLVDLIEAGCLFGAGGRDVADDVRHLPDRLDDFVERRAGRLTRSTPSLTCVEDDVIRSLMSFAACEERCARLRTSDATTAKPRPASPARAASTAALSASRLVCRAISSMTPMMSAILREDSSIRAIASTVLGDNRAASFRDVARFGGERIGLLGVLGVLAHRHRDLLHRGGGLFQARRLLFRALRQVGGAGRNLG